MLYSPIHAGRNDERAQKTGPTSIFEHIKFIDPIDPNKITAKPPAARSIFDYYTPIKMKKPDVNKRCYWDKRTFKIKEELERAVEISADKRRYELYLMHQEQNQEAVVESANRRSNLEGELYQL